MDNELLFLNKSIDNKENDIIGFDTYVDKLDNAIESGAQMIAITSPFGSGKTSIIELLKKKRTTKTREKFLNIQMWSQLDGKNVKEKSCELHKNFLYQIGSAISQRKGTFINRRLSNNYGLLKLHINKPAYWALLVFASISALLGWLCKEHSNTVVEYIPFLEKLVDNLSIPLFILAAFLFLIVITGAEIIFSSKKSENSRAIEADEIIDLYRNEIIDDKGRWLYLICRWLKFIPFVKKIPILTSRKYIIVIEDLDRSNDYDAVVNFLKELSKYYIVSNDKKTTFKMICTPKVRHFWRCIFLCVKKERKIKVIVQNSKYLL